MDDFAAATVMFILLPIKVLVDDSVSCTETEVSNLAASTIGLCMLAVCGVFLSGTDWRKKRNRI